MCLCKANEIAGCAAKLRVRPTWTANFLPVQSARLNRRKRSNRNGRSKMELTIDDKEMRDMVKEVVVEMIKENREGFCRLLAGAMEEVGLANAIKEGRKK